MKKPFIAIQINSLEEALNIENVAALTITKYQENEVEGQEQLQNNLIAMWRGIHKQAGDALDQFQVCQKESL